MKRILFQGDSITDCRRDRNDEACYLGNGYPNMVSGVLGAKYPYEYKRYFFLYQL